jgi:hypothetical protein
MGTNLLQVLVGLVDEGVALLLAERVLDDLSETAPICRTDDRAFESVARSVLARLVLSS